MTQFMLAVEAINLSNFVYDTQDLSTVRGGGLLLLNGVEQLTGIITSPQLKTLTTGASAGLFTFEADNVNAAQGVCLAVQQELAKDPQLKHATFAVSVQPVSGNQGFARDLAILQTKNRWQQMQSATLAPFAPGNAVACEIDLVRPATLPTPAPENKKYQVSESVYIRRQAGQQLKQRFYEEHIGRQLQSQFTHDQFTHEMNELAEDKTKGNLNGKLAVIYLDGNRFGAIKKSVSHSQTEWLKFDQTVKDYRRQLLEGLLDRMETDSDWQTDEGKYRIETLLWGGDELLWVVPAWKGWETLQFFYQQSENWQFQQTPLHHSGGMVFCHHNAPIHRITALARQLADLAKDKSRSENLFAYEVLESFDHIGRALGKYRSERCPQPLFASNPLDPQSLILSGAKMGELQHFVARCSSDLPRKPLHELAKELLTPLAASQNVEQRDRVRTDLLKQMKAGAIKARVPKEEIEKYHSTFGEQSFWLHVNALWDYLV